MQQGLQLASKIQSQPSPPEGLRRLYGSTCVLLPLKTALLQAVTDPGVQQALANVLERPGYALMSAFSCVFVSGLALCRRPWFMMDRNTPNKH